MAVIGITPCNRMNDYLESVKRAGGEPRVLSMDSPPTLDGLDGVLFTGGGDVDPVHYRDERHPNTNEPDAARDAFELALARLALASDTPLLAICRGLQVVNVAAGGTLVQDIPAPPPQAAGHQIDSPPYAIAHEVWVNIGTALARVMREELDGGEVLQVNSRHHQAVGRTAEGFTVSATAPDGIIEAIERPSSRFCIAVQWHPENFWRTGEFRSLFEAFVKAAESHPRIERLNKKSGE
jgi:putative glutamine amidotransferase